MFFPPPVSFSVTNDSTSNEYQLDSRLEYLDIHIYFLFSFSIFLWNQRPSMVSRTEAPKLIIFCPHEEQAEEATWSWRPTQEINLSPFPRLQDGTVLRHPGNTDFEIWRGWKALLASRYLDKLVKYSYQSILQIMDWIQRQKENDYFFPGSFF